MAVKVVFHELFKGVYDYDPAAAPGRMECIVEELAGSFEFEEPSPAIEADILLVHAQSHLEWVKSRGVIYDLALLSAGGAIMAAELALGGEPAFALVRPPGHHAGKNSNWGFCWFNNVAIAVAKTRSRGEVSKVAVVDIDLHRGDGTEDIFEETPEVSYYHLFNLDGLAQFLSINRDCDLVAVSAGFDKHVNDWGGILSTSDYYTIGKMISGHAREVCQGRVFAVLEGGYNQRVLGKNVKAFLQGLDG